MKITFLSPVPNLSGGCRVIAILADKLLELGHEVTIVAPRPPVQSMKSRIKSLARGKWPRPSGATSHYDGIKAKLKLLDHSPPIREDDLPDADVVIATWWETAFVAASLSSVKGRKFYFVQHHEVHDHLPSHISSGSYFLPLRKIAVSAWLADIMRETYGDDSVSVVPNSVDHSLFFAPPRERNHVPTVGFMYSHAKFKGVDTTLRAIANLKQLHTDLRVVAFGKTGPTDSLPFPSDGLFFARPDQNQLRDIYAMCDVFLMGSRSEGFGLPVLEAMACRCPVVATRTGCAADVIVDGANGFVIDVGDDESMARQASVILGLSAETWSAMSEAAFETTRKYTWNDAAILFAAALQRV